MRDCASWRQCMGPFSLQMPLHMPSTAPLARLCPGSAATAALSTTFASGCDIDAGLWNSALFCMPEPETQPGLQSRAQSSLRAAGYGLG